MNTVLRIAGILALFEGFYLAIDELQGLLIVGAVSKNSAVATGVLDGVFYGPALMLVGAVLLYFSLPARW